jgi:hypothetical protein
MTPFAMGDAYAAPPYTYVRAHDVGVVFTTDAEAVAAVLPEGLTVAEPARGLIRFVQQEFSPFGAYRGVYLSVFARYGDETVVYGVAGMKSEFTGVIAGREIWGMPLKYGDVRMTWHDNVVSCVAERVPGSPLCRLAARLGTPRDSQPAPMAALYRRWLPGGSAELVRATTEERGGGTGFRITATVAFASVADDDWGALPVRGIVGGRYTRGGSSVLGTGESR